MVYNVQCKKCVYSEQCLEFVLCVYFTVIAMQIWAGASLWHNSLEPISCLHAVNRVHCTLYMVLLTLYSLHCTMNTIICTLYIVHCTLFTILCKLYIVQCTLYSVHCTVYTVLCKCTLYTVILWFKICTTVHSMH